MHEEPTQLKVTASAQSGWLKNLALNVRGTGAVVIIVAWMFAVALAAIFASETNFRVAIFPLLGFMGLYLGILSR